MPRHATILFISSLLILGGPRTLLAVDPVTEWFVGHLASKLVDNGWDTVTGKPDLNLLDKRLRELEESGVIRSEMREEVRSLRTSLNNKVTKEEFFRRAEAMGKELASVRQRLTEVEEKVERLEVENEDKEKGTKNAKSAEFFLKRGQACLTEKKVHSALANFNIALRLDPKLVEAYRARCELFAKWNAWGPLVSDSTEALRHATKRSQRAWFYGSRAHSYDMMGDYDLAIADWTQILEINRKNVFSLYRRGRSYSAKKDLDRAISDLTEAIKIDPKFADAYLSRGVAYYEKKDHDRAINDYTQVIILDPSMAQVYVNRAAVHQSRKDFALAIGDYTQALKFGADRAELYYERGVCYHAIRDIERAIADYTKALNLDPKMRRAYASRGAMHYNRGDFDQAIADYNRAIELDPKNGATYRKRGDVYSAKGDKAKAQADYEEAENLGEKSR